MPPEPSVLCQEAPVLRGAGRDLPELERFFGVLRLRLLPPTELLFSLMESWVEEALPVASLSLIMLS